MTPGSAAYSDLVRLDSSCWRTADKSVCCTDAGYWPVASFKPSPVGCSPQSSLHLRLSINLVCACLSLSGYGDIHPVNIREMIFAMVYILFDLIFSAYLVGEDAATNRFYAEPGVRYPVKFAVHGYELGRPSSLFA